MHFHTVRKTCRELRNFCPHGLGGCQRIGARCELDRQAPCRGAIELGIRVVVFAAEFDPGDVADANLGAVAIHLQQDFAEVIWSAKQRRFANRRSQLLSGYRGQPP